MGDDRNEIAPLGEGAGFVTYSRIEPEDESGKGPILTGVRVAGERPAADGPAPDVRAEERVAPERRSGRAFAVFAVVALVAFAGGVGVLAGSFLFPTVGKVVPVPGGGKAVATVAEPAAAAKEDLDATDFSGGSVAEATPAPPVASVDPERFAAAHEPAEAAAPSRKPAPSPAESTEASRGVAVEAPPAKPPVPRGRPAAVAAAPAAGPSAFPDPLAPPEDSAATRVASIPSPAPGPAVNPAPLPPMAQTVEPPRFRTDATNDPLAPEEPVAEPILPQPPAASHVPPAEIPDRPYGASEEYAGAAPPGYPEALPDNVWSDSDPYQSALDRWVVLDVRNGRAVIDGRERGVFMVTEGSEIPGVGIVENIRKRGGKWTVTTTAGAIYGVDRERRRFFLSRWFN